MTVVATIIARDVRWMFARCSKTVMTGAATAQYLCVINRIGWRPRITIVAILTDVTRLHMRQVLARGIQTVVAANAIARNVQVIECRWSPCNCRVAVIASIAAGKVRRVLAGRDYAIVTRAADADDLRMVDCKRGRKYVGVMAVLAYVAGLDMRGTLTDGIRAVMAVNAATGDVQMIEVRRQPANCRVTIVTGVTAGDVCQVLASCRYTVMT